MALWFECKVRFDKMQENGAVKKVNEPYLVDALSFTEAEARIIEKMKPYISGDFTVSAVKKTRITDIYFDERGDKYYMVKYNILTLDEKSGNEKKSAVYALTQAIDFQTALANFLDAMKDTLGDYEIVSIAETPLMDVYPVDLSAKSPSAASES